jgi:hypothetical protein
MDVSPPSRNEFVRVCRNKHSTTLNHEESRPPVLPYFPALVLQHREFNEMPSFSRSELYRSKCCRLLRFMMHSIDLCYHQKVLKYSVCCPGS